MLCLLQVAKLLSNSNRTLKVSKGAPAWKAYVDYIGDILMDGLSQCIIASVQRLYSQVGLLLSVRAQLWCISCVLVPAQPCSQHEEAFREAELAAVRPELHLSSLHAKTLASMVSPTIQPCY